MRPAVVTARKVSSSCLLLLLCLLSFIIRASPLDRRIPDVGRRHRQSKERKTSGKRLLVAAQYPGQEPAEIARLLDAFGLKTVPRPNRTAIAAPPAFMLNLYHQLESTGSSSSLRQPAASPRANTVRSFNEKGESNPIFGFSFGQFSPTNKQPTEEHGRRVNSSYRVFC